MEKELMEVPDEEIDNCIKKFRNAVYGDEARVFITEYEELMLKKSQNMVVEARNQSRQSKYLSIVALITSMAALIIRILSVL